ncbi:MAG: PP2C family protein-serine/threonine phosphatase, partial [Streptomyces albidoflavus]
AWRTAVLCGTEQLEKVRLLEEILVAERSDPHVFATVTLLVFPPDRRSVRVVRAGHPGMLIRSGATVRQVETPGGMALGLLPGRGEWPQEEVELPEGGHVVLFTDGLFEGRTGPDTRLGEEGLLELALRNADLEPAAFVDALVDGASEGAAPFGGLADDVAVLHLGWGKS